MKDFDTLTVAPRAPGVAQVTMSRPAVFNAFDEAMIVELDAAFTQLAEDAAVSVIVLAGEGRHFSAGADLIILGNGCEKNPELLEEACRVRDKIKAT